MAGLTAALVLTVGVAVVGGLPAPAATGGPTAPPASPGLPTGSVRDLAVATCPAIATPAGVRIVQPEPGSTWSSAGPLPLVGTGAPSTGVLTAAIGPDVDTQIARIDDRGGFRADLLLFPPPDRSRETLLVSWRPHGASAGCARSVAGVAFWLEPTVPISVWLLGGPPRHLSGPPFGLTVVGRPQVTLVEATVRSLDGRSLASGSATAVPAGRAVYFRMTLRGTLIDGPADLRVRWSEKDGSGGSLEMPVAVVPPEIELP